MARGRSDIERCTAPDCAGARVRTGSHCLAHLTGDEFDVVVASLRAGERVEARDTKISSALLDSLLTAVKGDCHRLILPAADFKGATFSGDADFSQATFSGYADFKGATFSADADFSGVTFSNYADFHRATFRGEADFRFAIFSGYSASFSGASFDRYTSFGGATFNDFAHFDRATFSDNVGFDQATFSCYADFRWATFNGNAGFASTTFSGAGRFAGATFNGSAFFERASFARTACFNAATFSRAGQLGPLVVCDRIVLDHCVFTERVTVEATATIMSARATTFAAGVHLRVRWAEIALDDADFARASTLSSATTSGPETDLLPSCIVDGRNIELEPRPRLISLRGAHVSALSLSDIDLRACQFFGAHGLESLSIEASCRWPHTPPGRRHIHRETIAEEHYWRGPSWKQPSVQAPRWLDDRDDARPLASGQIAALYRALRKAREDGKDTAGAGDLYYGEMEMRRHTKPSDVRRRASRRIRSDHAVLTSYWLISGYGLKASRALSTLFVVIVLASFGLQAWGFSPHPPYPRALMYGIESTSSLLRTPQTPGLQTTYAGEAMHITLRLVGPLLIGLALLAVRARVKR